MVQNHMSLTNTSTNSRCTWKAPSCRNWFCFLVSCMIQDYTITEWLDHLVALVLAPMVSPIPIISHPWKMLKNLPLCLYKYDNTFIEFTRNDFLVLLVIILTSMNLIIKCEIWFYSMCFVLSFISTNVKEYRWIKNNQYFQQAHVGFLITLCQSLYEPPNKTICGECFQSWSASNNCRK